MAWSDWIAWKLKEAKHTLRTMGWHFRPGMNFVKEMHEAIAHFLTFVTVEYRKRQEYPPRMINADKCRL